VSERSHDEPGWAEGLEAAPESRGPSDEDPEERRGTADVLDELVGVVSSAKSMPLSSSAIVARDEVLALLEEARERLPEELRRARHLLKERAELLAVAHRDAGSILEDARVQAERMVQRTEIVRQAEHRARALLEEAEAEARRLRREAEDYIDQKLAAFEIVLERTLNYVRAGREKLAAIPGYPDLEVEGEAGAGPRDGEADGLFDQDVE
jgi:vacuolar-type H+-ATPase subunit H